VTESNKQCLLIKTTHAVVYTYSLLSVFISQYGNKVEYISIGEEGQSQTGGATGSRASLEAGTVNKRV